MVNISCIRIVIQIRPSLTSNQLLLVAHPITSNPFSKICRQFFLVIRPAKRQTNTHEEQRNSISGCNKTLVVNFKRNGGNALEDNKVLGKEIEFGKPYM